MRVAMIVSVRNFIILGMGLKRQTFISKFRLTTAILKVNYPVQVIKK
jgi:hypothetical protein